MGVRTHSHFHVNTAAFLPEHYVEELPIQEPRRLKLGSKILLFGSRLLCIGQSCLNPQLLTQSLRIVLEPSVRLICMYTFNLTSSEVLTR
jgi:hypothetical protein